MDDLHAVIGQLLGAFQLPGATIMLDQLCGGKEQIRLYGGHSGLEDPCIAYADAAILFRDKIDVVIEIEESNVTPVHFCGKYLATALSTYYKGNRGRFPLSDSLLFIQIFKKTKDNENWSKYNQCRYLELVS